MRASTGTLVLMGSGETTPTMVTTHQQLFAHTAEVTTAPLRAAVLDTPYGFQANAQEISDKARQYFDHNVGQDVAHLQVPTPASAEGIQVEAALDAIRQLDWLFAGPGSPTYAARQWLSAPFPDAMAGVAAGGGTLILASAAAVTAGTRTIPVYEIYKAGAAPHWAEGLDILGRLLGWRCVVIPHFDNAEGGTHDTRFCYLGEPRLQEMEAMLEEEEWILGVDEHTAAIIDIAGQEMRVAGRGAVHVRRDGQIVARYDAGKMVSLADLVAARASSDAAPHGRRGDDGDAATSSLDTDEGSGPSTTQTPFVQEMDALSQQFDDALADHDSTRATTAALGLEALIRAWAADTDVTDEQTRATAILRGMITRLGTLAGDGMHDHTDLVRPHIETLLHVREDARDKKAFEVADHIRVHLDGDGVRVKDTRDGTQWEWDEPELPRPSSTP